MACSNCSVGLFINGTFLSGTGTTFTSPNGTTVHITSPSSLTVSKGASPSLIFNAPSGGQVHFMHWGSPDNFLAVMTVEGGSTGTRTVVLINTSGATLTTQIITTVLASSSTSLPQVHFCPGDGSIIFTRASNGTELTNLAIWTADTGDNLTSAGSFVPSAAVVAEVTATQLQIKHGTTVIAVAPKPQPNCDVTPATVNFPDAVIGPGVDPALSVRTGSATIENVGQSCLNITSISNNAPYSVTGTVPPLPVSLGHGQSVHMDLQFAPTALGTFNRDLAINPVPGAGDTVIHCHGLARAPILALTFTDPLNFGSVPLGSTVNRTLNIQNTGEGDVTVNIPGIPPGSQYQWTQPGTSHVLHPSAPGNTLAITISFTPTVEGLLNQTLTFTSTAGGGSHTVHLNGSGCVPRPVIQLPSAGPVSIGDVQQGFRTVRMFRVRNTGNALLQFSAHIVPSVPGDPASEAAALLFGLVLDTTPVTSPLSSLLNQPINPTTPCGPLATGTGEFLFGIAFFANQSPAPVSARLEIFNHNDTTPGAPSSFFIALTATITNPISVDVELVLDRSGSMGEPSGSRIKIETARDAARLFVQLSRPDVEDRIGLVRFNTLPQVVRGIDFITTANQGAIASTVSPANFFPDGGTAVAAGILTAEADIAANPRATVPSALNKIIVALTDGHDNTPFRNPADGIFYTLLGGDFPDPGNPFNIIHTTPLPVPADIKIYAIGIGDSIDIGRLSQLSASSGGAFLQAREFSGSDFFQLEKHFTQTYMEAVNYAPIEDPEFDILPGETHDFFFEVLPGDKSAIVVIYDQPIRLPFTIFTPTGETVDLLSVPPDFSIRPGISPTARFLEVNMPQNQPERYAGTWNVRIHHDHRACVVPREAQTFNPELFGFGFQPKDCKENFNNPIHYGIAVGVTSNFVMFPFVTPGVVRVGETIQLTAMLSEYGLPATGCDVTVKAVRPDGSVTNHSLFDDGLHGDDGPADATYGIPYVHTYQEGTYIFTFTATGKSRDGNEVKREAVRSKFVEGQQPLVPENPRDGDTDANRCCRLVRILLITGLILVFLILVLIFLIWLRS